MRTHTTSDPQQPVHPTASPDEFEPSLAVVGTFAAGQSSHGEFHVAAEAAVGSFASGLTDDDRREPL
jgi:hypothetical protein